MSDAPDDPARANDESVTRILFQLDKYLNRIQADNIFEFDGELSQNYVQIDSNWRAKATTYVQHIRESVRNAEMEEALREAILNRVNQLQQEIDRNRVRISAVTEAWLVATEAVGKGAKNMEPVITLFERIAGAFSGLRRSQQSETQMQLPAPEALEPARKVSARFQGL